MPVAWPTQGTGFGWVDTGTGTNGSYNWTQVSTSITSLGISFQQAATSMQGLATVLGYATNTANITGTVNGTYVWNDPNWLPAVVDTAAQRRKANEAAEELLKELVGDGRYRIWKEQGHLVVASRQARGHLAYRLRAGHKIELLQRRPQGGWKVRRDQLCIHPRDTHPAADEVAALYVLARYDEDELWKTANHHGTAAELAALRAALAPAA